MENFALKSLNLVMHDSRNSTSIRALSAFSVKESVSDHYLNITNLAIDFITEDSTLTFELFECLE